MIKVNQIAGLNKKARTFLLDNCVSKRGVEVMAYGFKGFINGQEVNDITLIRKESKWEIFVTKEAIQSINGTVEFFAMTKNTILN